MNVHDNQTPSPNTAGPTPPAHKTDDQQTFSELASTLKNLKDLFLQERKSSSEALAKEAGGLADTLASASNTGRPLTSKEIKNAQSFATRASQLGGGGAAATQLQVATAGLSVATLNAYTASLGAPQLANPAVSTLSGISKELIKTLNQPALLPKLSEVLSMVMELMRKIQQEEAEIQGKAIEAGVDQAVAGAKAEVASGAAQAQKMHLQAQSQLTSAVSNFCQAAVQAKTLHSLTKTPDDVKEYDAKTGDNSISAAKNKADNSTKLVKMRDSLQKDYEQGGTPGPNAAGVTPGGSPNKIMNERLDYLTAKNNANIKDPTTHPPLDTKTNEHLELTKLTEYKKATIQFANEHPNETIVPDKIANREGGKFDSTKDDHILDIKDDKHIAECAKKDNAKYESLRDERANLMQRSTSQIQAKSQIGSAVVSGAEKGFEAHFSNLTADEEQKAAAQNALKQLASTTQGLMQNLQQMGEKGHDSIIQSLSGMLQLLQSLIQSTQQNWSGR